MSGMTNGLDAILGWNAVKVGRLIGVRLTAALAEHDLSLVQFGVLSTLAADEDLTTAEIARAVFVRPQSMAEVLDGMERRGLLRRAGVRRQGKRNPVVLTAAGRSLLDTAQDLALRTNDLGSTGLSAADAALLNRLLVEVITRSEQADGR